MTPRKEIPAIVAGSLDMENINDLPMIRQALNDTMDSFIRMGMLSEAKANMFSQSKMVAEVKNMLKMASRPGMSTKYH